MCYFLFLGECVDGKCICHGGYFGIDCAEKICPNHCTFHGLCKNGTCYCEEGWTGSLCNLKTCPNFCNNK